MSFSRPLVLCCVFLLLGATRARVLPGSKDEKDNGYRRRRCITKPTYVIGQGTWPDNCANTRAGTTCVATCAQGHNATGTPSVTCQADLNWSQPLAPARCEPAPVLPPDDGGGAALPVDVALTASACQQSTAPGATTSVTFDVTAPYNPEYLLGLTIQVTFATVLWPNVVLTCQDAAAQPITCDPPAFTADDLAQDTLALACLLGDMSAASSAAQCTLTYTTPATSDAMDALRAAGPLNIILGTLSYLPFPSDTIVEDESDNSAETCAVA